MVRTRTGGSDNQAPVPLYRAARGRGRGRGRGKGHPRGASRAPARAAIEEPPVAPAGGQAPEHLSSGWIVSTCSCHISGRGRSTNSHRRYPEQQFQVDQDPKIIPVQSVAPVQPEVRAAVSEVEQLILERYKKYHPPTFSRLALEDAQSFLEECHRILSTMGAAESSGVSFTAFQLRGAAYQWWRAYELSSPAEAASLTWTQFSDMFLKEYVPQSLRVAWRTEFEQLCQGAMTVSEYAIRLSDLARHASSLVSTV
ncbi:uncharacterized protein [Nicotiana tomentosiformis]|uniref:uncharacterized protein n=1 Tax=Nicotiana tomentosiformis TaxID=4098 RepID=UPI00388C8E1F